MYGVPKSHSKRVNLMDKVRSIFSYLDSLAFWSLLRLHAGIQCVFLQPSDAVKWCVFR